VIRAKRNEDIAVAFFVVSASVSKWVTITVEAHTWKLVMLYFCQIKKLFLYEVLQIVLLDDFEYLFQNAVE